MLALSAVLKHNPACPVREIGEGLVIMAPQGETTHSVEDLGAFIWKEIDGVKTLETILEAILSSYDVEKSTAEEDLLQFTQKMVEAELLLTS